MVQESKVWLVHLRRGEVDEIQGALTLEAEAIMFRHRNGSHTAIPFDSVRRVRRRRGSPILMVTHEESGRLIHAAFYFAQPPPLSPDPVGTVAPGPLAAFGSRGSQRSSKRKVVRGNVSYLSSASLSKKAEIETWVEAIRDRMAKPGDAEP